LATRTLLLTADDTAIKALVVEWSELLAQGRFADALALVPSAGESCIQTPEVLERTIAGYGRPEPYPNGEVFAVTPLLDRPDAEEIIRDMIQVDREHLYGLDPERYLGVVHYNDVPLNGKRSYLTARFGIRRVGANRLALDLENIYVDWNEITGEYWRRTWDQEGGITSLPADWQRELVALGRLESNVFNGGYLQFLVNMGRESYVYASRALKKIGAHRTAAIIDLCQALVDEHFDCEGKSDELGQLMPNPVIGRDGTLIKEAGSVLPDPVLERIYELSYEFMNYPDDVGRLGLIHYRPYLEGDSLSRRH
jgi:hypothetical protein